MTVKRPEWTKGMKNHGSYPIRLLLSRDSFNRVVYEDADGRFWIDFYKQKVEVVRSYDHYRTVGLY